MRYALLALFLLWALLPIPAYAIANPDTPPAVNRVDIYEDLLETGDVGVIVDYYLDYAVLPTETATESYLAIFIDTDGVTQLRSVAPYTYISSGYRRGVIWIYFSAADAASYSLDSALVGSYRVWLAGNATCCVGSGGWAGDPPLTVATVDNWQTVGDPAVLLAQRILALGAVLETAWGLDVVETTALGTRLTTVGDTYFDNVIPNVRTMAPSAFASGTVDVVRESINTVTSFGGTVISGDATVDGSPVTLASGSNTINISGLGATGSFTVTLNTGTEGTVTNGTGTVAGSPVDIVGGVNSLTATVIGTLIVDVALVNTQTQITDTITGTGLDLSGPAAIFGMSTFLFSGFVWLVLTIAICAASMNRVGSKPTLLVFEICIVGGTVLGLVPVLAAGLLTIAWGTLVGYILFFRGANF